MKIYKQYKDENKKNLSTEKDLIYYCEDMGYWEKGTAIKTLKEIGTIQTPCAIYTIEN